MSAISASLSAPLRLTLPSRRTMLDVRAETDAERACALLVSGAIDAGMRLAVALLGRLSAAAEAPSTAADSPSLGRLLTLLRQNPLVSWGRSQHYGYPADPVFVDMGLGLAQLEAQQTELGMAMYSWMLDQSSICKALRLRRDYLARCIDSIAIAEAECRAVSLFGGHAREIHASHRIRTGAVAASLVDYDTQVLARAASAADYAPATPLHTCQATLDAMLSGQVRLYDCSLLLLTSVTEFLDKNTLSQLLQSLLDWLRPGGEIVMAAFEELPESGFLDLAVDWRPNTLSLPALLALTRELEQADARVFGENEGHLGYLHVRRL